MPLAQLGEKTPTKKILMLVSQGRSVMCWFNQGFQQSWLWLTEWWLFSWLAQDQLPGQSQMPGGKQGNDSRHSFWLDLLAPLFTRTVDKVVFISPDSCSSFPACACPEHSHHSTTSVRAVRMGRCTKDQTFLLDEEIQDLSQQPFYWGPFKVAKKPDMSRAFLKAIFRQISEMVWFTTEQQKPVQGPGPDSAP